MSNLEPLFAPFHLRNLSIPNRIVMAPMTRSFSPEQVPTQNVATYYRKRAEGGVGLIITEGTTLRDQASTSDHKVPKMTGQASLAGWKKVVDEVHDAGGLIFPQLWHVGVLRKAEDTGAPERETLSPSGILLAGKKRGRAMTEEEIADTVADYGEAAANAVSVGFDGIEIHGAHGYLIDQFFWDVTNQRSDRYGGDRVARTRFAAEVIAAVRSAVGPEYPIVLRYSQWKQQDFAAKLANTPEELEHFLAPLTEAGVDCFHCSQRRYWEPEFEGSLLNLAGWTKKLSGKPTITVGSIGLDQEFIATYASDEASNAVTIDDLLERLERGEFDLAAVGRALIANPDWPQLVREGKALEARPYDRAQLAELV